MEPAIGGSGSHIKQMLPDRRNRHRLVMKKELIEVSRFVNCRSLAVQLDGFRRPGTIASAIQEGHCFA